MLITVVEIVHPLTEILKFSINLSLTLLFFPNSTGDTKLQLLSVTTREEESHVSMDNQTIVAISNLPVTISNAPRHPLPGKFSAIATHFQAVAEVPCFAIFPKKP